MSKRNFWTKTEHELNGKCKQKVVTYKESISLMTFYFMYKRNFYRCNSIKLISVYFSDAYPRIYSFHALLTNQISQVILYYVQDKFLVPFRYDLFLNISVMHIRGSRGKLLKRVSMVLFLISPLIFSKCNSSNIYFSLFQWCISEDLVGSS